jgi:transposase InsO family protein
MREMSVVEQKYQAILAVIAEGRTIAEVAAQWRVSRRTLHRWLARYELEGLEGLTERSHRPGSCPHQMTGEFEVRVLELRRVHRYWGPHRIWLELAKRSGALPSESAIYRCLVRAGVIDPVRRQHRKEHWKRWERGRAMELWQMDVVHGFALADGTSAKALTGIDDHSRFCVAARLMPKERTQLVCDGFGAALSTYGVPEQVLTDNGKVFTGKFARPPVEVLFDRICRENGVEHLLTQPRTPTTTGKIERFHRTLRIEFDTRQVFTNLKTAQGALDEWVAYYNTERAHQSLGDATPVSRFQASERQARPRPERDGDHWVTRRVARNGVISVGYQQVSVGKNYGGSACDVLVTDAVLQCWVGSELLKTVTRKSRGDIRKKHAEGWAPRR